MKHSWATELEQHSSMHTSHQFLLLQYFRPMSHFSHLSLISRLSWVLWALMLSRSAAVWSMDYFSVSSYKELRWNKRTMQEKIASIVSVSVIIL